MSRKLVVAACFTATCFIVGITSVLRATAPVEHPITIDGQVPDTSPGAVTMFRDESQGATSTIYVASTTPTVGTVFVSSPVITVTNRASGAITVMFAPPIGGYGDASIDRPRRPTLTVSCTDDGCEARGDDMTKARAMLERIADRGVKIDVRVDQYCHPEKSQHETIAPRDAVASSSPPAEDVAPAQFAER